MTKGTEAGKAYVTLGLNAESLERGLKKAGDKVSAMGKRVTVAGAGVAGAGAAVLTPLLAATNSFASAGDKLHKMSLRTGASVESLSAMAFAAEQSGTSIDAVGDAMFRTSRRIANAAQTGMGPAARALKLLGIDMQELNSLSADEQFLRLADVLGNVEDEAFANQMGFEILGDSFKQLKPLMDEGGDGIRALMNEAGELGRTMSTEDANAAAAFGDAMNRVSSVATGLKNQIGAALAPILAEAATHFAEIAKSAVDFVKENRGLVAGIAAAAAAVVGLGTALSVAGVAIIGIGMAITALGSIVGLVLSPAGLLIGGMVAAAAAAAHYFGFIEKATAFLGRAFQTLSKVFSDNFGSIMDELKAGNLEQALDITSQALELIWLELGEGMMSTWDNTLLSMSQAIDKFVKRTIGVVRALALVMQIGVGEASGGLVEINIMDDVNSAIKSVAGAISSVSINQDDVEQRKKDREQRRTELTRRGEQRAKERQDRLDNERRNKEQQDAYANRQQMSSLGSLDLTGPTGELAAAGGTSTRGTFSAFAAMSMGAGSYQDKMLKANKDTAKHTADIAKNTRFPDPSTFNA